jgi:hypothetical protein
MLFNLAFKRLVGYWSRAVRYVLGFKTTPVDLNLLSGSKVPNDFSPFGTDQSEKYDVFSSTAYTAILVKATSTYMIIGDDH